MKDNFDLTAKEKRFADEYIINGRNATQAYKTVQPNSSDGNARARGSEWRAKRNVSEYIKWKTKERLNASNLKADDVIDELISIGFGKALKGYSKKTDKQTGVIEQEIEYESTAFTEERIRALELLGKSMTIFTEKHDVAHSGGVQFVDDISDEEAN